MHHLLAGAPANLSNAPELRKKPREGRLRWILGHFPHFNEPSDYEPLFCVMVFNCQFNHLELRQGEPQ